MKVWLSVDNKPFDGHNYKVISPLNGDNPFDLDTYIDDNECNEIVVSYLLEYLPIDNIESFLHKVVSKLKSGAKLIIEGTDCIEVNKAFYSGLLTCKEYNIHIFGSHNHAWDFKQSCVSLFEITNILKNFNLKIINKRLPDLTYSIIAENK